MIKKLINFAFLYQFLTLIKEIKLLKKQ